MDPKCWCMPFEFNRSVASDLVLAQLWELSLLEACLVQWVCLYRWA